MIYGISLWHLTKVQFSAEDKRYSKLLSFDYKSIKLGFNYERENNMTKNQINKFAVGYPYPTEYVEILLKKYNYDTVKVHEILCKPSNEVIMEVQNKNGVTVGGLLSIMEARQRKRSQQN